MYISWVSSTCKQKYESQGSGKQLMLWLKVRCVIVEKSLAQPKVQSLVYAHHNPMPNMISNDGLMHVIEDYLQRTNILMDAEINYNACRQQQCTLAQMQHV